MKKKTVVKEKLERYEADVRIACETCREAVEKARAVCGEAIAKAKRDFDEG